MTRSGNESSFIRAAGITNRGWELVHSAAPLSLHRSTEEYENLLEDCFHK